MRLNSIIIDDEPKSREVLKSLVSKFCDDVDVAAVCQNGDEAIEAIQKHKPQVVFLDVQLQRETGFDVLERLGSIDFEIIFTTAYSEYAISAFKYSAIDYLLKPIDVGDLKRAIEKVRKRLAPKSTTEGDTPVVKRSDNDHNDITRLRDIMDTLRTSVPQKGKLAIPTLEGFSFINIEETLYLEAADNYTIFYMADGKNSVVSRTLKEYDEILSEQNFFRIHKSCLVNLNAVKKYIKGEGGQVVLTNDKTLDVSKRRKQAFLERLHR